MRSCRGLSQGWQMPMLACLGKTTRLDGQPTLSDRLQDSRLASGQNKTKPSSLPKPNKRYKIFMRQMGSCSLRVRWRRIHASPLSQVCSLSLIFSLGVQLGEGSKPLHQFLLQLQRGPGKVHLWQGIRWMHCRALDSTLLQMPLRLWLPVHSAVLLVRKGRGWPSMRGLRTLTPSQRVRAPSARQVGTFYKVSNTKPRKRPYKAARKTS